MQLKLCIISKPIDLLNPFNMSSHLPLEKLDLFQNRLKALVHPLRIKIVKLLHTADCLEFQQLQNELEIEQSHLSQHLKLLKNAELIEEYTKGKKQVLCLNHANLYQLLESAYAIINSSERKVI